MPGRYQVHSTIVSDSRHSCHGQMSACISLCLDDGQQKRKPDDSFIKIWLDRDSKIDVEFRCGLTRPHPASLSLRSILSRDGGGLAWLGGLSAHVSTLDIFLLGRYLKYIPADHVSFPRCRCCAMPSSYAATQKQPSRRYVLYSFHTPRVS